MRARPADLNGMTHILDLSSVSTDGTLQRFTLAVTAQETAADFLISQHEALLAANDPDSVHALGARTGVRVHVRGDVVTVVDLRQDLVTEVRRVLWLDAEFGVTA